MNSRNAIIEKIKEIKGNIILIGIYDDLAFNAVDNNDKIENCMILNDKKFTYGDLDKTRGRIKRYNMKKLRKTFKKKSIDNIIASYEEINNKMHHFIKNSVYITRGTLHIYCDKNDDIDEIVRRYKRYNITAKEIDEQEYKIVEVNINNAKNKKIKDFFYTISDYMYIVTDFIGDILTN